MSTSSLVFSVALQVDLGQDPEPLLAQGHADRVDGVVVRAGQRGGDGEAGHHALRFCSARAASTSRLRTPVMTCSSAAAGKAPGWENTSVPPLNAISVGMDVICAAAGERLLGLGVDLAEHDVGVGGRRLLVHGREHPARAAPGRPEVDEDDVVAAHGALEVLCTQVGGGHQSLSLKSVGAPDSGAAPMPTTIPPAVFHHGLAALLTDPLLELEEYPRGCVRLAKSNTPPGIREPA